MINQREAEPARSSLVSNLEAKVKGEEKWIIRTKRSSIHAPSTLAVRTKVSLGPEMYLLLYIHIVKANVTLAVDGRGG